MSRVLVALIAVLQLSSLALAYQEDVDLNLAMRYVELSGASYCADPKLKRNSVDDWSCNVCSNYPNMTAKSFYNSKYSCSGFVGYDADTNEIVVAFAGTDPLSIRDWIDDLVFVKEDYPYCDGCDVHKGFYETFLSMEATIKEFVYDWLDLYPSASIAIVGHSLGAALAAHCTAEFTHVGGKLKDQLHAVYTYGMPRVGNDAFQSWYKETMFGTFRFTHRKDPVPHLPPIEFDFHHIPYEVFYTEDYNDYTLCSFEGEDESCADQYTVAVDLVNHLNYLDFDFTTNYLSCGL
mmetsp:Transcript_23793/g.39765  ORF Transcript_23793/g.39765 Transcript_23793/m.39765 type:complete len:292 (-) Transcript_23793:206-1081(-)